MFTIYNKCDIFHLFSFYFELYFCFQLGQYGNLLCTLWSTIVNLFWALLRTTVIVLMNSKVWSLLITASESTSHPIPKSPSNALLSIVSCSLFSILLKISLSFELANSCNEILFLHLHLHLHL